MLLIGSLFAVAVVLFTISLWYVHMRMDDEYNFLRREISDCQVDHGARLANLEMASPGLRERLDALEVFLDIEMKAEPTGNSVDGWKSFRTVYRNINRCKKCGGRT